MASIISESSNTIRSDPGPPGPGAQVPPSSSTHSDLAGIFSLVLSRQQEQGPSRVRGHRVRSSSADNAFPGSSRPLWTKYCVLCTVCGAAATILATLFLIVSSLFRYYTTSVHYFETVPTYVPAILLSICGVSTIAFSCKRNRNITLLRITAFWSLLSGAICSIITITTSLVHMNRLQTLKECVFSPSPPSCTCFSHSYVEASVHYVFENTAECGVIHGILYACLRAVFAISVVAVLLSIFLCMLLYQLIGHERKKAYWSRIRRINSDWSADFAVCLQRPLPRDRSSMFPILMSPTSGPLTPGGLTTQGPLPLGLGPWGPPPPYESLSPPRRRNDILTSGGAPYPTMHPSDSAHTFISGLSALTLTSMSMSNSSSFSTTFNSNFPLNPHPFSPTITALNPAQGVAPPPTRGIGTSASMGAMSSYLTSQNTTKIETGGSLSAACLFPGNPAENSNSPPKEITEIPPKFEISDLASLLPELPENSRGKRNNYSLPSTPIAIVRGLLRRRGSGPEIDAETGKNPLKASFQKLIDAEVKEKAGNKKKWVFGARRNVGVDGALPQFSTNNVLGLGQRRSLPCSPVKYRLTQAKEI